MKRQPSAPSVSSSAKWLNEFFMEIEGLVFAEFVKTFNRGIKWVIMGLLKTKGKEWNSSFDWDSSFG